MRAIAVLRGSWTSKLWPEFPSSEQRRYPVVSRHVRIAGQHIESVHDLRRMLRAAGYDNVAAQMQAKGREV